MNEETKKKITWAIREELRGLDPKSKDRILNEIFSILDHRIRFHRDYEKLLKENCKISVAAPLYLTRSE